MKIIDKLAKLTESVKRSDRIAEIFRFAIVGLLATIIQYILYLFFINLMEISPEAATPISYMISLAINYILTSYFTFKSNPTKKNGIGFAICHLINMGLQTLFVRIFSSFFTADLALLPTLVICVPTNYVLLHFVFKRFNKMKASEEI